ncbi:MAG: UvrD-helicase domain-containing protein, partial [Alphaproteobacteria bacterium]|nr:UvrD-helicase domain-containing protein [Alphaproteobacteria bacterium]
MLQNIPLSQNENDYLRLNQEQLEAVGYLSGPLLVLSGAGTGKTRVLTSRIAHILNQRAAFASQILAVTFTNKAANEMRERLGSMVGPYAQGLWLGTFHSIGAKILRIHAEKLDLTPQFTILDSDDQLRLIKQILKTKGIDEKQLASRLVLSVIQRWKDRGLTSAQVAKQESGGSDPLAQLYVEYQSELKRLNAVDFGDLILHVLTLFQENLDVLSRYANQFKFILVDEYQDTNIAQYLWLRLLSQGGANMCCVGDDDQSIYGWRGAEVGNILKFERDFPDAKVVRLEQNYRSTPHILGLASHLIASNKDRLGKTLWTQREGGDKVYVSGHWDGGEEARYISDEIEACQRNGVSLNNMAILIRAGFQTGEFEECFLKLGIPYKVIGGLRFYERQEIRDALAYLRLVAQSNDSLAFERVINVPKRGIGATSVQLLQTTARHANLSLMEIAKRIVETDELKGATRHALRAFIAQVEQWQVLAQDLNPSQLAEIILQESGYIRMWDEDTSPDAPGRIENLKEFVTALQEFSSLTEFLEHVSLVMENNTAIHEEMVSIMTLHSAKGLEFDTVFLAGWEEGLFPHPRALDEKGSQGLEEERRLAYVGITRAKKRLYITFAANRRVHNLWQSNLPSRFIEELKEEHIERVQTSVSWGKRDNRSASTFAMGHHF